MNNNNNTIPETAISPLENQDKDTLLYEKGEKILKILLIINMISYIHSCLSSLLLGFDFDLFSVVIHGFILYAIYEGKTFFKYGYGFSQFILIAVSFELYTNSSHIVELGIPIDLTQLWFSIGISILLGISTTIALFFFPPITFYFKVKNHDYFLPNQN